MVKPEPEHKRSYLLHLYIEAECKLYNPHSLGLCKHVRDIAELVFLSSVMGTYLDHMYSHYSTPQAALAFVGGF